MVEPIPAELLFLSIAAVGLSLGSVVFPNNPELGNIIVLVTCMPLVMYLFYKVVEAVDR